MVKEPTFKDSQFLCSKQHGSEEILLQFTGTAENFADILHKILEHASSRNEVFESAVFAVALEFCISHAERFDMNE